MQPTNNPINFRFKQSKVNDDKYNMDLDSMSAMGSGENIRSLHFIFICDISGSMQGYKIQQVNKSVAEFSQKFR